MTTSKPSSNAGYSCPKCSHTRSNSETVPDYECPSCGVVYEKYLAQHGIAYKPMARKPEVPPLNISSAPSAKLFSTAVQTCPKCRHVRGADDMSPESQCPKCGIIYSKYEPTDDRAWSAPNPFASATNRTCPRCQYKRRTRESVPEDQCPSCGVLYAHAHTVDLKPPPPPGPLATQRAKQKSVWQRRSARLWGLVMAVVGVALYIYLHHVIVDLLNASHLARGSFRRVTSNCVLVCIPSTLTLLGLFQLATGISTKTLLETWSWMPDWQQGILIALLAAFTALAVGFSFSSAF